MMKSAIKAVTAVTVAAAMGVSAAAANMEGQAASQLTAAGSLTEVEAAAIPVPTQSILPRDVFGEVDACSVLHNLFVMQPTMKDALGMLNPCLAGVSRLNNNAAISAVAVKNGEAIEIVVTGRKNDYSRELIRRSLEIRNDRVFGYPASVVLR